jgi:2-phosphosulfolactate phosphatase
MGNPTLSVIFRKENIPGAKPAVAGRAAIVLDVLRASSTMVCALANGAREIVLASTPKEAREHAAKLTPGTFVLGGERHGLKLDGFDLGNSPRDYVKPVVGGKTVVFTTTNGTEALRACAREGAASIWVGAILNVPGIVRAVLAASTDVVLVGAGTTGTQGSDDAYGAGMLVAAFLESQTCELDDSAILALNHFRARNLDGSHRIALEVLRESLGGRSLIRIGLGSDLEDCDGSRATPEMRKLAPRYDPVRNSITV